LNDLHHFVFVAARCDERIRQTQQSLVMAIDDFPDTRRHIVVPMIAHSLFDEFVRSVHGERLSVHDERALTGKGFLPRKAVMRIVTDADNFCQRPQGGKARRSAGNVLEQEIPVIEPAVESIDR